MNRFVYLAGPVLGMTETAANNWRKLVARALADFRIVGISPLRCEPIHGETYEVGYPDERFGTARAIMSKNMFDVKQCDMVLAYIPKPEPGKHHSWGTMQELAWGRAFDKPVILVSDDPEIREHPVINASCGWVLDNLEDAVAVVVGILGGYTGGSRNV